MLFYMLIKDFFELLMFLQKVFYYNESCKYKDKEFHSRQCTKAYDSQDDEDFDAINYETISNKQKVGLINLGNTSFMNSSLQSIFSSTHFQEFFSNKQYWTQNTIQRNVPLNYKLEKLLKNLKLVNSYSDDESREENGNQKTQWIKFHKNIQQNQIDSDNYEQAVEQQYNNKYKKQIVNSFLRITQELLNLKLNVQSVNKKHKAMNPLQIATFFKCYYLLIIKLNRQVKRDIGEQLGIEPTTLLGVFCLNNKIDMQFRMYIFHDEDLLQKILNYNQNSYFCLFQLDQTITSITDEDQYFDVMIYSYEKSNAFSNQCQNISATIPKILIIKKQFTSTQIYQLIWNKLGKYSKSEQLIDIQIDKPQLENLLNQQQVQEILNYQIFIQTRFTIQKILSIYMWLIIQQRLKISLLLITLQQFNYFKRLFAQNKLCQCQYFNINRIYGTCHSKVFKNRI
ncbi:unnamed protein product [Paramecium pentaurelia]|uniref:Peptidase C19 ubiquitin carboxyl-terminal hydrolase domain-containing protein n=1 Tax=Paramecium pentaurelia TaxID=43138 RepID=A0A8S1V8Q6_9CILI|nr:unnamed protein product [Paramecium pentaurelia]